MSEPVQIGIPQVYALLVELKGEFGTFANSTAIELALLKRDVERLEKENEANKVRRWQLYLALLAAVVAIAMGSLAIILK
jgi:hypothetical protein